MKKPVKAVVPIIINTSNMASVDDIALSMIPGLGVRGAVHLLRTFGSSMKIFKASISELTEQAQLRLDIAKKIIARDSHRAAEREWEYCRRNNITAIASTDIEYPSLLLETDDYPTILYVQGNVNALAQPTLSMVGTRRISQYGLTMCEKLVAGLAEQVPSLTIISGLAFGVDVNCQRAAVRHGLKSVGVLANALPEIMPAQHTRFAREMIDSGGAIVTELNSQSKQNGRYYLPRNRIIAALSAGTVIVESDAAGGSLHTAAMADGYNRTVMAVPGRATDRMSTGTNLLIRNHKAQLILSAEDIVREMMWDISSNPGGQHGSTGLHFQEPEITDPDEMRLLDAFPQEGTVSVEELQSAVRLPTGVIMSLLLNLELSGAIKQLPGGIYTKSR